MSLSHDPYDIWASPRLGKMKYRWSNGEFLPKLVIPFVGIVEVLFPVFFRRILGTKKHKFAHVEALKYCYGDLESGQFLETVSDLRVNDSAWGLPFGWYSKNGIYDGNTPYITNTPYVMEALISCAADQRYHDKATDLFYGTWDFLESLPIKYENKNMLALSYAPVDEPRIVINANSYSAFAYALHVAHGRQEIKETALQRSRMIIAWLLDQQNSDGSWDYYADSEVGNFIDCFHSCFIIKNLIKVRALIDLDNILLDEAIKKGWEFIRNELYDSESHLCRRFSGRGHRDPFQYELYDQAEYLGLLVDFGLLKEAKKLVAVVDEEFRRGDSWYCRIDIFGRRWGKNFMRWGIVPFIYHKKRLEKEVGESGLCAES